MKKLKCSLLIVTLLAARIAAMPAQAAEMKRVNFPTNSTNHLTLDLACDGSLVCRIQNSSLAPLNGNVIWFYQRSPSDSSKMLASRILLELPDGAVRGFAIFSLERGYISLGRNGEGSLARFTAFGALAQGALGPTTGTYLFHVDGTYRMP